MGGGGGGCGETVGVASTGLAYPLDGVGFHFGRYRRGGEGTGVSTSNRVEVGAVRRWRRGTRWREGMRRRLERAVGVNVEEEGEREVGGCRHEGMAGVVSVQTWRVPVLFVVSAGDPKENKKKEKKEG